ncbi:hypothetical protein EDD15DRAFT_1644709 [Pisolithus albus]|nr:hypothetical protein EDD15DRAFT_1644709 [Pisolithus albus]
MLQSFGSQSLDDLFMALKGMTLDTAYASFSESVTGSLTMASEILGTKVLATVIDGEVVYGGLVLVGNCT